MLKNHRSSYLAILLCVLALAVAGVGVYCSLQKRAQKQAEELMARALRSPPGEAEKLLRQAVELRPGDAHLRYILGETLNMDGQSQEALRVLEEALKVAETRDDNLMVSRRIQSALARIYEDLGDYDKAIEYYRQNLTSGPMVARQGFARIRLGDLYRRKGDDAAAAREYGVAIRAGAASNRPEIYFTAGMSEARLGDTSQAYSYLVDLFDHPSLIGVRPGDGLTNSRFRSWIEAARQGRSMKTVRSVKGFDALIARADQRAQARTACTRIYRYPIEASGFRRELPTSAESAKTYARYAGFSRDVLLAYANDDYVNADYEIGDDRRFSYGFGGCYYYFHTPDQAREAAKTLMDLSLPGAEWARFRWVNHSLAGRVIGDETRSADDKNGNMRLIVRKRNFLAVFYCGEFDRIRSESIPPNVGAAMDAVARQVTELAF